MALIDKYIYNEKIRISGNPHDYIIDAFYVTLWRIAADFNMNQLDPILLRITSYSGSQIVIHYKQSNAGHSNALFVCLNWKLASI